MSETFKLRRTLSTSNISHRGYIIGSSKSTDSVPYQITEWDMHGFRYCFEEHHDGTTQLTAKYIMNNPTADDVIKALSQNPRKPNLLFLN